MNLDKYYIVRINQVFKIEDLPGGYTNTKSGFSKYACVKSIEKHKYANSSEKIFIDVLSGEKYLSEIPYYESTSLFIHPRYKKLPLRLVLENKKITFFNFKKIINELMYNINKEAMNEELNKINGNTDSPKVKQKTK